MSGSIAMKLTVNDSAAMPCDTIPIIRSSQGEEALTPCMSSVVASKQKSSDWHLAHRSASLRSDFLTTGTGLRQVNHFGQTLAQP